MRTPSGTRRISHWRAKRRRSEGEKEGRREREKERKTEAKSTMGTIKIIERSFVVQGACKLFDIR